MLVHEESAEEYPAVGLELRYFQAQLALTDFLSEPSSGTQLSRVADRVGRPHKAHGEKRRKLPSIHTEALKKENVKKINGRKSQFLGWAWLQPGGWPFFFPSGFWAVSPSLQPGCLSCGWQLCLWNRREGSFDAINPGSAGQLAEGQTWAPFS